MLPNEPELLIKLLELCDTTKLLELLNELKLLLDNELLFKLLDKLELLDDELLLELLDELELLLDQVTGKIRFSVVVSKLTIFCLPGTLFCITAEK